MTAELAEVYRTVLDIAVDGKHQQSKVNLHRFNVNIQEYDVNV
jgi:hypothetical protein